MLPADSVHPRRRFFPLFLPQLPLPQFLFSHPLGLSNGVGICSRGKDLGAHFATKFGPPWVASSTLLARISLLIPVYSSCHVPVSILPFIWGTQSTFLYIVASSSYVFLVLHLYHIHFIFLMSISAVRRVTLVILVLHGTLSRGVLSRI